MTSQCLPLYSENSTGNKIIHYHFDSELLSLNRDRSFATNNRAAKNAHTASTDVGGVPYNANQVKSNIPIVAATDKSTKLITLINNLGL